MGPLFSIVTALILVCALTIAAGIVIASAFRILRRHYARTQAFVLAGTFAIGTLFAAILALLILGIIIAISPQLNPDIAVGLSIAWIACASLTGGMATMRYTIRWLVPMQ